MNETYLTKVEWDRKDRICPVCGTIFSPKAPNHIYCCKKCYKIGHNQKMREENAYQKYYHSGLSPNMQRIMAIVKDDPNYGQIVVKEGL